MLYDKIKPQVENKMIGREMKKIILRSIFILVAVCSFAILAICMQQGDTLEFDNWVYGWVSQTIMPWLTEVLKIVTYGGNVFVVAGICGILLLIPNTRKNIGLPSALSVVVAVGVSSLLKGIFARPRPDVLRLIEESGYSFPSAHALLSATLYIMLIILVCKYTKSLLAKISLVLLLCVVIGVVGYSRIYMGVHYASDVVGGWIMGFAITLLVYTICRLTFLKE